MAAAEKVGRLGLRTAFGKVVNSSYFFWAVLALPSIRLLLTLEQESRPHRGPSAAHEIVEVSGIFATFLLLIALALSPLRTIFPNSRVVGWLLQRRRYIGVAAFSYSVVHLVFYFVDLGSLREILEEFATPGILTGWVALFIFIPVALTSNAVMTRIMGWRHWKMLQRSVYVAAVLVLAHWLIVDTEPAPLVFFGVLALWSVINSGETSQNRNGVRCSRIRRLPEPTLRESAGPRRPISALAALPEHSRSDTCPLRTPATLPYHEYVPVPNAEFARSAPGPG